MKGKLLVVAALAFLLGMPAFGCWVCSISDGNLDCENQAGETGGTSCVTSCSTKCTCRTFGACIGNHGCGGQPCPTIQAQGPGDDPVWITRGFYEELRSADPDAASLLVGLAQDPDILLSGVADRVSLLPGEYQGMIADLTDPQRGRASRVKAAYRYRASVTPQAGGVAVKIEVFGHPTLQTVSAQVCNGLSCGGVEIGRPDGRVQRVNL